MNTDEKRAVAGLLRAYGQRVCELVAAREMLTFLAKNQKFLVEWEQTLEQVKATPEYSRPAQGVEAIALALEESAVQIDLNALLQQLPKGTPIN